MKFLSKKNISLMAGVGFLIILYFMSEALMPFFLGIALGYICGPLVGTLHKKLNLSLCLSSVFCIAFVYLILIFFILKISPVVYSSFMEMIAGITTLDLELLSKEIFEKFRFVIFNHYMIEILQTIREIFISKIPNYLNSILETILSSTHAIISMMFSIIFAPVISFYFLTDFYFKDLDLKVPIWKKILHYINDLAKTFVQVQTLMVVLYSCYYCILTMAVGLPSALSLGIICGITYIIPYIGLAVSLTSCIFVSIIQYGIDYHIVFLVVGFLLVVVLDTAFISPRLVGPKFGLHPLLTIFSIIVSANLFGILGVIFALPIAVITRDMSRAFMRFLEV